MSRQTSVTITRLSYTLIGAIAGLAAWGLIEQVPGMIANARIVLFLIAAGLGFFSVLLALLGPLRFLPAVLAALSMALPAALLLLWASFRHARPDVFLDRNYALTAYIYLLAISAPFVVAGLEQRGGWRQYGLLFDAAWALVMRVAAAGLFVAVVWAVLLLSDALLGLVGLSFLSALLKIDAAPWLISGIALGLGLAVVHELRDVVSPFLVIQLLRALLPAFLVVLGIFVIALPFRGFSELFGQFSAAATLLAVTIAGITLVTTAMHRDDTLSVQGAVMRGSAWALSLILPVPAALAIWAISLRVQQYGLTPDRIAALVAAGVVAIYALAYAGAVLLRRDSWPERQRRVNRGMALVTLAVAAAWLTPVLNAERLSVASQLARADKGLPVEQLALWEMGNRWGIAGQNALSALEARAQAENDTALLAQITQAKQSPRRWDYVRTLDEHNLPPLAGLVPLRPEGAALPQGALDTLTSDDRRVISEACQRRAPGGHPGCVLVIAEFEPGNSATQAIGFFMTAGNSMRMMSLVMREGTLVNEGYPRDLVSGGFPILQPQIITDIIEERFHITPLPRNVLEIGEMKIFPQN